LPLPESLDERADFAGAIDFLEPGSAERDHREVVGFFALQPGKSTKLDHVFDVAQVVAQAAAHLDDFEKTSTRFPNHTFAVRTHDIDRARLAVVAFVQDEESKVILQAAFARPPQE
jgi:hypothetical protein